MKLLSSRHAMVPVAPAPMEIRSLFAEPEPTEVKPLSSKDYLECLNAYREKIGASEPTATDQEVIRGLQDAYERASTRELGEIAVST